MATAPGACDTAAGVRGHHPSLHCLAAPKPTNPPTPPANRPTGRPSKRAICACLFHALLSLLLAGLSVVTRWDHTRGTQPCQVGLSGNQQGLWSEPEWHPPPEKITKSKVKVIPSQTLSVHQALVEGGEQEGPANKPSVLRKEQHRKGLRASQL